MTKETNMTKDKILETRVDKIENESFKAKQVNCGVSVNLWLVLGVVILVVFLLGKMDRLEKKLSVQPKF